MKFFALIASVSAVTVSQLSAGVPNALAPADGDCDPALDVSQKQLDIELDFFSRTFDQARYRNALVIYKALMEKGEHPRVSVHTW